MGKHYAPSCADIQQATERSEPPPRPRTRGSTTPVSRFPCTARRHSSSHTSMPPVRSPTTTAARMARRANGPLAMAGAAAIPALYSAVLTFFPPRSKAPWSALRAHAASRIEAAAPCVFSRRERRLQHTLPELPAAALQLRRASSQRAGRHETSAIDGRTTSHGHVPVQESVGISDVVYFW